MKHASLLVVAVGAAATFAACSSDDSGSGGDSSVGASSTVASAGVGAGGAGGSSSSSATSGGDGGAGAQGGAGGHGGSEHGATTSGGGDGGAGGSSGCVNVLPTIQAAPPTLAATGLYANASKLEVAAYAREYAPRWMLWSDGEAKRRFVYLTECGLIDTTDMDDWRLPVGARAWKEFSRNGKRLETRFMHRFGEGPKDILYATYLWNEAQTEATLLLDGAKNVLGTGHDVPDELGCKRCHGPYPAKGGLPSRFLGFEALQLSHDGPGLTLATLMKEGRLSSPPVAPFGPPGDAVAAAALGYLHVNCGNCHNDSPDGLLFPAFNARLRTTDVDVEKTGAYLTMVNQKTALFVGHGCTYRIAGGDTADSCSMLRMSERGTDAAPNLKQMPPLGTELADATGLAAVGAWIATLPPPPPP
jgi:hypothetical protein